MDFVEKGASYAIAFFGKTICPQERGQLQEY